MIWVIKLTNIKFLIFMFLKDRAVGTVNVCVRACVFVLPDTAMP